MWLIEVESSGEGAGVVENGLGFDGGGAGGDEARGEMDGGQYRDGVLADDGDGDGDSGDDNGEGDGDSGNGDGDGDGEESAFT